MITITSGQAFTDIDAYASALAYAELLRLRGRLVRVVLVGQLNYSIPSDLRQIAATYSNKYEPIDGESFVVVDVSEPENIANFVDMDRVDEVIDHHPGMELYWQEKIGDQSDIEPIGAVCTQIYERWVEAGKLDEMNAESATLLAAGILDNTLNFTAQITTERDRAAYKDLIGIAGLPLDWEGQYFSWCQKDIERDLPEAIRTDTKRLTLAGYTEKLTVGQLAVWDAEGLMSYQSQVRQVMRGMGGVWFVNIMSIKDEQNHIMSEDAALQDFLSSLLGAKFIDNIAKTDRLWLRKEIMQAALNSSNELS